MGAYISNYLDNILSWAESGIASHRGGRWRTVQRATRPRTTLDLAAARRRRTGRRRAGGLLRREWSVAMSGVRAISRPGHSLRGVRWRLASFVVLGLCACVLAYGLSNSIYFVDAINLSGAAFVPGEDIYRAADVGGENILWVNPREVEGRIEQIPGVEEALVRIEFPAIVNVQVVEQKPVMSWRQGGETVWVDARGEFLPPWFDVPWLLPVTVDDIATPVEVDSSIPLEVVIGATQLKSLRPNIELLHYDSAYGLSYQDGRNWRGYFGTGGNMAAKLEVYETLVSELMRMEVYPSAIYVSSLDTTYYVE